MTLRIAFFLVDFGGGGAERSVITLAHELQSRGHEITIIVERRTGPLLAILSNDIEVVDIGGSKRRVGTFRLTHLIGRRKFDFFISGTENLNAMSVFAKLFLPLINTKFILVERTSFLNYKIMHKSFLNWLLPILYPFADHVITLSHGLEKIVIDDLRCKPENVTTIPNAFDLSDIRAKGSEAPPHPWLRDKTIPVIVTSGRLRAVKDFPTLLRSFALLRREMEIRLIILGEGPEKQSLQALIIDLGIAEDVDLAGFSVNPFCYYANADLFVLSSLSESFSRVVVESMAVGTPVVATNCGGPTEILDHGRYGGIVPIGNPQAMALAIKNALGNPFPRDYILSRVEQYEVGLVTDAYLKLMREL